MPRRVFDVVVIAAMVLLGAVLTPLRCARHKALFSPRVAAFACAVSFIGLALAACAGSGAVDKTPPASDLVAARSAPPEAPPPAPELSPRVRPPSGPQRRPLTSAQCGPHGEVLARLAQRYREAPVAAGITLNGGLITVLTTGDGATWSILVTTPQGIACLVAAGEDWQRLNPAAAEPRVSLLRPIHGGAAWIMEDDATRYCCGPEDCNPAPLAGITVTEVGPDAWRVRVTDANPLVWSAISPVERVFRAGDPDLHLSVDDRFWVCLSAGRVKCLFRPGPGV